MEDELLSWFGNALNFVILIYLIAITYYSNRFSYSESLLAAFGLMVSILIQLRNVLK